MKKRMKLSMGVKRKWSEIFDMRAGGAGKSIGLGQKNCKIEIILQKNDIKLTDSC